MADKIKAFEEASKIRRGEGELPDYEIIQAWIARAPETWIPALLRQCVASAVVRKCFKKKMEDGDSGIVAYVRRMEGIARDPLSMLRGN